MEAPDLGKVSESIFITRLSFDSDGDPRHGEGIRDSICSAQMETPDLGEVSESEQFILLIPSR